VAKKIGATVTPEVFLFNRKRVIGLYKGAIDDGMGKRKHGYIGLS
jgi:hypothetical protein